MVLYETSMGAYGCLLLCNKLKANTVLAMSPNITMNFEKGAFEIGWQAERENIMF